MNSSIRLLGIAGLTGAPFLLIDTINNDFSPYAHSSLSGMFNLIYMGGWICSIIALHRMGAFGRGRGQYIFFAQLIFLVLGESWALYEMIQPGANTPLYFILDIFWPLSNVFMLVTGITIVINKQLSGWRRFIPLAVGCWLPFGSILWAIFSRSETVLLIINIYSAIAWSLMAWSIISWNTSVKKVAIA